MSGIIAASYVRQDIVYDVDFQTNVLDVISTNGYPMPPRSRRVAANWLMLQLKDPAIDLFDSVDTLALFAWGNPAYYQASLIDWKRTNVLYTVSNVSFTAEGLIGNGTSGYVDTVFNPATSGVNYVLNKASMGTVVYEAPTGNSTITGINGMANNRLFAANVTTHRLNGSAALPVSVDLSGTGFTMIARPDSANLSFVKKGVNTLTTQTSTSVQSANQRLLNSGAQFGNSGLSLFFMGEYISNAQAQALRAVYNQYCEMQGIPQKA